MTTTTVNKSQPSVLPAHPVRQAAGATQTTVSGTGLKVHPPIMTTKVHDAKLQHDGAEHSPRHPLSGGPMLAKGTTGAMPGEKMSPKMHHLISVTRSPSPGLRSNVEQVARMSPQSVATSQTAAMTSYQQHQQQFDKAKAVQLQMHRSRSHPIQPKPEEQPGQMLSSSQSQSPMWAKVEQTPLQTLSEAKTQSLQQWSKSEASVSAQSWSQIKSQSVQSRSEEGSPWATTAVHGQAWSPSCPKTYKGTYWLYSTCVCYQLL